VATVAGVTAAVALLTGGGDGKRSAGARSGVPAPAVTSHVAPAGATPRAAGATLRRQVQAASELPQTHTLPSSRSRRFRSLMDALWEGVRQGRVGPALIAFFPKGAYVRLKAIYGAASDWQHRLLYDYGLDVRAAHRLLGARASRARLVGVIARSSYAHWVESGVCSNDLGYFEMPNARVVYSQDGHRGSFGIASMISWRGEWYVVHLGAILRPGEVGEVDEPAAGVGEQAYSGTC
jgi:hypothetical protein